MDGKKKPRTLGSEITINGVKFSLLLYGRTRKRVILSYWYWDCTGGLKGWEPCRIYDMTFESKQEAWEMYKFFRSAENIREYVKTIGRQISDDWGKGE